MMQKTTVMPKILKQPKMKAAKAVKKKRKQPTCSHVHRGQVYLKNVGRYNEVTKDAIGTMPGTSVGD